MEHAQGRQVKVNGRRWEIATKTGIVHDSQVRSELSVSGGGGSGVVTTGPSGTFGSSSTAPISSKTTNYQNLFLIDKDGKEHLIQTTDNLITCHPGQQLSMLFAVPVGKDSGPYFAAYNHSVDRMYYIKSGLNDITQAGLAAYIAIVVVIIGLFIFYDSFYSLILSIPIAVGIKKFADFKGKRTFHASEAFRSAFEDVKKMPKMEMPKITGGT